MALESQGPMSKMRHLPISVLLTIAVSPGGRSAPCAR